MSDYFSQVPNFEYVSRLPDAKIGDYVTVKNLFKRGAIEQDVLDNYYYELSQKSFDGKQGHNRMVDYYLKEISPEKKEEYFNEIVDGFQNLGVNKVFEILKTPGEERLSQEILLKILKTNSRCYIYFEFC